MLTNMVMKHFSIKCLFRAHNFFFFFVFEKTSNFTWQTWGSCHGLKIKRLKVNIRMHYDVELNKPYLIFF